MHIIMFIICLYYIVFIFLAGEPYFWFKFNFPSVFRTLIKIFFNKKWFLDLI